MELNALLLVPARGRLPAATSGIPHHAEQGSSSSDPTKTPGGYRTRPAVQALEFRRGNGDRLHAYWAPADDKAAPLLLYLHGARWNLTGSVTRIERWRKLGFNVLAIDYRGFGKSSGASPSEQLAYEDAMAAWDYLADAGPARPRFIVGHSLGGAIAAELAVRRPEASGLVLEATFTSIRDMLEHTAWRVLPVGLILTQEFDTLSKLPKIHLPFCRARHERLGGSLRDGRAPFRRRDRTQALHQGGGRQPPQPLVGRGRPVPHGASRALPPLAPQPGGGGPELRRGRWYIRRHAEPRPRRPRERPRMAQGGTARVARHRGADFRREPAPARVAARHARRRHPRRLVSGGASRTTSSPAAGSSPGASRASSPTAAPARRRAASACPAAASSRSSWRRRSRRRISRRFSRT